MASRDLDEPAELNDLWIATVALANDVDVVTPHDDIELAGGPTVIRVSPALA